MTEPVDYMKVYGGTGLNKITQSFDLQNQTKEQKPILQCKYCGKKNGGHYIMCSAWID